MGRAATRIRRLTGLLTLFAVLLAPVAANSGSAAIAEESAEEAAYEFREEHDPKGIGKFFMGREIAATTGPDTADWQERPSRAQEQRPDLLIENLGLEPELVVADIGAGTGYHSFRIAGHVERVLAVEIDPGWIQLLEEKARKTGVENLETVLGTVTDPRLPPESVDLVLMVDVYHELSHPREMMGAIKKALKPAGRVVLVEYRLEDPKVRVMKIHKMNEQQLIKEFVAHGFVWLETRTVLPQQHLVFFRLR